jgi:hypothetical protein
MVWRQIPFSQLLNLVCIAEFINAKATLRYVLHGQSQSIPFQWTDGDGATISNSRGRRSNSSVHDGQCGAWPRSNKCNDVAKHYSPCELKIVVDASAEQYREHGSKRFRLDCPAATT